MPLSKIGFLKKFIIFIKITFSLHKEGNFSSFHFRFQSMFHVLLSLSKLRDHAWLYGPCFVEMVSHCLGSKPSSGFTVQHFWIITLLECVCHSG